MLASISVPAAVFSTGLRTQPSTGRRTQTWQYVGAGLLAAVPALRQGKANMCPCSLRYGLRSLMHCGFQAIALCPMACMQPSLKAWNSNETLLSSRSQDDPHLVEATMLGPPSCVIYCLESQKRAVKLAYPAAALS